MTDWILAWDDGFEERQADDPDWEVVEERIAALDGAHHTIVTIYRGTAHMACGGSAETGVVLYATFDNEQFWQLTNSDADDEPVSVVAGGQAGQYPRRVVVTAGQAHSAMRTFLESGVLHAVSTWVEQ